MPAYAVAVALLVGVPLSVGALVIYWRLSGVIVFRKRGYRVRRLRPSEVVPSTSRPKDHVYEELAHDGTVRALPFARIIVEPTYPARSEIDLPDELRWNDEVPAWAQGRRTEIAKRIVDALGTESHVRIVA